MFVQDFHEQNQKTQILRDFLILNCGFPREFTDISYIRVIILYNFDNINIDFVTKVLQKTPNVHILNINIKNESQLENFCKVAELFYQSKIALATESDYDFNPKVKYVPACIDVQKLQAITSKYNLAAVIKTNKHDDQYNPGSHYLVFPLLLSMKMS